MVRAGRVGRQACGATCDLPFAIRHLPLSMTSGRLRHRRIRLCCALCSCCGRELMQRLLAGALAVIVFAAAPAQTPAPAPDALTLEQIMADPDPLAALMEVP